MSLTLKNATLSRKKFHIGPLTWQVNPGEIWAVLGTNGSGKSTLLKMMAGVLAPHSGELSLNQSTKSKYTGDEWARRVAWMQGVSPIYFRFKVRDLLKMGRFPHGPEKAEEWIQNALEIFELKAYETSYIDELSEGEKQRVRLAQSWVQDAEFWLLDEPFEHLDIKYQRRLADLFKVQVANKKAVICVSHYLQEALSWATHILWLKSGEIVHAGPLNDTLIDSVFEQTFNVPFKR
jgi:iron complex transport system ATP-binding protein